MTETEITSSSMVTIYTTALTALADNRALMQTRQFGTERGMVTESIDIGYDEIGNVIHPQKMAKNILSLLDRIPEEHRESAYLSLNDEDYGYSWELTYSRPETDEEMSKRLAAVERQRKRVEDEERARYEELKARFG
jgi:hypothetical protein